MRRPMMPTLVLFATLLAGCGGGGKPARGPAADPSKAPEEVILILINGLGDRSIVSVLAGPSYKSWSVERMGDGEVLAPRDSLPLRVAPGMCAIRLTDEERRTYTRGEVRVGPSGRRWEVLPENLDPGQWGEVPEQAVLETGSGDAFVEITNGLVDWDILYVSVEPHPIAAWGENRLEGEPLRPGDLLTVRVDPGTYDVVCEDRDGLPFTLPGVALDAAGHAWRVTEVDMGTPTGVL